VTIGSATPLTASSELIAPSFMDDRPHLFHNLPLPFQFLHQNYRITGVRLGDKVQGHRQFLPKVVTQQRPDRESNPVFKAVF